MGFRVELSVSGNHILARGMLSDWPVTLQCVLKPPMRYLFAVNQTICFSTAGRQKKSTIHFVELRLCKGDLAAWQALSIKQH